MSEDVCMPGGSQDERYFVKFKLPNLLILMPSRVYYGRVKIAGRTLKKCLDTTSFEVGKRKLKRWLDEVCTKPTSDSTLGSLTEEYQQRLQLQVAVGDIKPRTMDTKLESLEQCQKVWQELFSTGKIDPDNYGQGGDHSVKVKVSTPLFNVQGVSKLTTKTLDHWRAGMIMAYAPSRVNGGMTVMRELLDLAVELGFLFDVVKLRRSLGYTKVTTVKLTHRPTVKMYHALVAEIHARATKGDAVFKRGLDDGGYKFEFLCTSGARNDSANHLD